MMSIVDKLQTIANNEQKVYDAGKTTGKQSVLDSVSEITVAGAIKAIDRGAFMRSSNLKSVVIEEGITDIGYQAFYQCTKLKTVVIPDSVTTIRGYSFRGLSALSDVTFGSGIRTIGKRAFTNTPLSEITLPASVTTLDDEAFSTNGALHTVTFRGTPQSISATAFKNTYKLTNIYVPWAKGDVENAPWGATNATIHYALPSTETVYPTVTISTNGSKGTERYSMPTTYDGFTVRYMCSGNDGFFVWHCYIIAPDSYPYDTFYIVTEPDSEFSTLYGPYTLKTDYYGIRRYTEITSEISDSVYSSSLAREVFGTNSLGALFSNSVSQFNQTATIYHSVGNTYTTATTTPYTYYYTLDISNIPTDATTMKIVDASNTNNTLTFTNDNSSTFNENFDIRAFDDYYYDYSYKTALKNEGPYIMSRDNLIGFILNYIDLDNDIVENNPERGPWSTDTQFYIEY